jgi:hypothetical protein
MRHTWVTKSWAFRGLLQGGCLAGLLLVASCSDDTAPPSSSAGVGGSAGTTGGSAGSGVAGTAGPTSGGTGAGVGGGTAGTSTSGGSAGTGVAGTAGATAGTAGMSAGGSAGTDVGGGAGTSTAGGGAGTDAAGGTAGTSDGGTAGTSAGNAGTSAGGAAGSSAGGGQGGAAGGGAGTGPGVEESASCPDITWPSSSGSRNLGSGITVGGGEVYDGQMNQINGSLENCAAGDQDSVDPLIEVENGGTVKNLVMGPNVGDGIHCLGSCTIENVWFPNVCDDAISIMGSGTVTIRNSGFKNARDKTIQHNGTATVNIENVYVETAGKLYRSCGDGCSGSNRTANLTNIVAIGVDQVAGVSENDTVTLENICVHRTFSICAVYEPGSSDESTTGVNGSNDGPNDNCRFSGSDTHALLSRVGGIPFTTESVCGGPNGYKSGSTATSCVDGFDKCLKACMPGGYGFKEITCTNGRYAEGAGVICAMPTESTAAQNLAPSRVMGATQEVDNNAECSTEWAIGIEESNNANYCVCVHKPGYYSNENWLAWDCQRRWW